MENSSAGPRETIDLPTLVVDIKIEVESVYNAWRLNYSIKL